MPFGDMFKKKLGEAAALAELPLEKPPPKVVKDEAPDDDEPDEAGEPEAAAKAEGGLLDPVDGITLEQYATVQARRAKLTQSDELPKLLAEHGMDEAKWAQVDKVFMERMSDPSDPLATAAFATEYGKFFSAASSEPPAASASSESDSHEDENDTDEPVSFERYVEILTAEECWAAAGKDLSTMLKEVFDLTTTDWSTLGAYWSLKMVADPSIATTLSELQEKYRAQYTEGSPDGDADSEEDLEGGEESS